MSRTKREILDTEAMLTRLTNLLVEHAKPENKITGPRADAESLRRISMTLHRWHELECGNSDDHGSWAIVRGGYVKEPDRRAPRQPDGTPWPREFMHDDDGDSYLEHHHYRHGKGKDSVSYTRIPDREAGARKRLAAILSRYPALTAYVQTDPRGCALYILKPGDVPEGEDVSAYYSRGLAVFR